MLLKNYQFATHKLICRYPRDDSQLKALIDRHEQNQPKFALARIDEIQELAQEMYIAPPFGS
jgi:hypothetical protein